MATYRTHLGELESLLSGMRFCDLLPLLRDAVPGVPTRRWPGLLRQLVFSLLVELSYREEKHQLKRRLAHQQPRSPLFVLGCPRSGTTRLHNLLWQDARFGVTTLLQTFNPHNFFFIQGALAGIRVGILGKLFAPWRPVLSETEWRRPYDQAPQGLSHPFEDVFAMHMMNQADTIPWVFPSLGARYTRYITLEDLEPGELARWKRDWLHFLNKVTLWNDGRRLVLKSPGHTARIKTLLSIFPDAKFIFLHRNPYETFASYKHKIRVESAAGASAAALGDTALNQFVLMHEYLICSYLERRSLIPEGNLHELSYAELTDRPLEALQTAYEELSLGDFGEVQPRLEDYIGKTRDHPQNVYSPLEPRERSVISDSWSRFASEFGYELDEVTSGESA